MALAANQSVANEDVPGRISIFCRSEVKSLDQLLARIKKQWIRIRDLQALPASEHHKHAILVEVVEKYDLRDLRKTKMWMSFRVKEVAPTPRFEKAISALPVNLAVQITEDFMAKSRIDKGDILAIISPSVCSSPKPNTSFDVYTHDLANIFVWKQGNRTSASANANVSVCEPPWPQPSWRNGNSYHYSSLNDCAQRLNDKRNHFYAVVTGILRPPAQSRPNHTSWHAMYAIVDKTCHKPVMDGSEEYEKWIHSCKPQPKDYAFHIFEKEGKDAFPPIKLGDVIRVHRAIAEIRQSRGAQTAKEIPQASADFRTFSGSSVVIFRRDEPPISTGTSYSLTDEERRLAMEMLNFSEVYMQEKDKVYKVRTFVELSDFAAEPETYVNLAGKLVFSKPEYENEQIFYSFYLEDGTFCNLPLEKTSDISHCVRKNQETPLDFPVVKIKVPLEKVNSDENVNIVGNFLILRGVLMKKSVKDDYEYFSFSLRGSVYILSSCSELRTTIWERISNLKRITEEESEEILWVTLSEPLQGVGILGFPPIHLGERAQEIPVTSATPNFRKSQQQNRSLAVEQTVPEPSSSARTESPEIELVWDSNAEQAPILKTELIDHEQPIPYRITECSSLLQSVTRNGNDHDEEMDVNGIVEAIMSSEKKHQPSLGKKIKLEQPITTPSPIMDEDLRYGNSSPSAAGHPSLEIDVSVHSGEESDPDLFEPSPNLRNAPSIGVNLAQVVSVGTVTSPNTPNSIYGTPREDPSQVASLRCAPGPPSENRTMQNPRGETLIPIRITSKLNEDEIELDQCDSESQEECTLGMSPVNSASRKRPYNCQYMEATRGKRLAKDSDVNGQRVSNDAAMAAGVLACEKRWREQLEGNVSKIILKGLVRELELDPAYSFEDLKQAGRKSKIIGVELDERLGELSVRDILSEWVFGVCSTCRRAYSHTLFRNFTSDSCTKRDVIPSYSRNVLSKMVMNNFKDGSADAGEDEVHRSTKFTCRLYHCPHCIAGNVEFTECYLAPNFFTSLQLKDERGERLDLFLGGLSAEYFFGVSVNAFLNKPSAQERFMTNLRKLAGQRIHVGVQVAVDNEGQQKLQIFGTKNEF